MKYYTVSPLTFVPNLEVGCYLNFYVVKGEIFSTFFLISDTIQIKDVTAIGGVLRYYYREAA